MGRFACQKCGEPYSSFPPDETHRKASKYPDRSTIPLSIRCKVCDSVNRIYWKE